MTSRLAKAFAISTVLLLAGTAIHLHADDNARTSISREAILGALNSSGIGIVPGQMEQLSAMTSAEANPQLRVVSVEVLDADSDKVLLRCEHSRACLPFYVLVHWAKPGDKSATYPGRPGQAQSASQGAGQASSSQPAEDWLVRSGKFVMLMLDGEYVHMILPVLCLENGGRGQQVRVISKSTKRRYLARVTGPGLVKSVLSE
jgi:hypothetical protein